MRLIHFPYRWMWSTVGNSLHSAMWDICSGFKNLWRWFPIIWHDRDWDWAYLVSILEYKFDRMKVAIGDEGHLAKREKHARQLLICRELCKRLNREGYMKMADRVWPWDYRRSWAHEKMLRKQDLELLGQIMGKYLCEWWD